MLHIGHMEHVEEGQHLRELVLLRADIQPDIGNCLQIRIKVLCDLIRHKIRDAALHAVIELAAAVRELHDQIRIAVIVHAESGQQADAEQLAFAQQNRQNIYAFELFLIGRDDEDFRECVVLAVRAVVELLFQLMRQLLDIVLGAGDIAEGVVRIPCMRQPAHIIPLFRIVFIVNEDQLQLVIGIQGGQLHDHAPEQLKGALFGAVDAADAAAVQRKRDRDILDNALLADKLHHVIAQIVLEKSIGVLCIFDLHLGFEISDAEHHAHEILVPDALAPEQAVAGDHAGHAGIQPQIFFAEIFLLLILRMFLLKQIGIADDGSKRCADIMTHIGDKLGLHPLAAGCFIDRDGKSVADGVQCFGLAVKASVHMFHRIIGDAVFRIPGCDRLCGGGQFMMR